MRMSRVGKWALVLGLEVGGGGGRGVEGVLLCEFFCFEIGRGGERVWDLGEGFLGAGRSGCGLLWMEGVLLAFLLLLVPGFG